MLSVTRTNGFQLPLHPCQILSWVVFGLDVSTFLVFGLPLVEPTPLQALIGLLFAASGVILVAGAVAATLCDPTDPCISDSKGELTRASWEELRGTAPWCKTCLSYVRQRSKHCRTCRKCVDEFDHHCIWLNNCIGASNYRAFVACIVSVIALTSTVLCTAILLLVDHFENGTSLESHGRFWDYPNGLILGILCFLVAVNLPLFALDLQLCLLHAFLAKQNLTTFEYIMQKKEQEDELAEQALRRAAMKKEGFASDDEPRLRRFDSLPRFMDWIVFNRRRKGPGDASQDSAGAGFGGPKGSHGRGGRGRAPSYTVIGNPVDAQSLGLANRRPTVEYDPTVDLTATREPESDDDRGEDGSAPSRPRSVRSVGFCTDQSASDSEDRPASPELPVARLPAISPSGLKPLELSVDVEADGAAVLAGPAGDGGPVSAPALGVAASLQSPRSLLAATVANAEQAGGSSKDDAEAHGNEASGVYAGLARALGDSGDTFAGDVVDDDLPEWEASASSLSQLV